ncbi:MAG: DegV family protein [Anaerolineae bacterium]|jgi:DegV family protein with EDD domain|nr:DegV family protein [Anaerolineae bacterium]MBT7072745.1 DegV family protein [Anaerolineae bacterium]MBT7324644.1 DegV family protein [Anaerolineae bacterium]
MKIVTDCAADLSAQECKELGVVEAPLFIQFPEGEINATDITPDEFYDRLEAMRPAIPTTAQPSAGIFQSLYEKLAETKEQVLSIHISSGLSGTLNSAITGAAQLKEKMVSTVDSMTLSGGQRFQVLAAVKAAKAGWNLDTIKERLDAIRAKTEVIYTLETLEYLARGGRIGRVQALAGSLLNIKPVIRVDRNDGKYTTVGKGRTVKKNVAMMVDHLSEMYGNVPLWATVLHGRFEQGAEMMSSSLQERLNIAKLEVTRISPVLGVHTGPGIVGAAILPMSLIEDLL